MTDAAGNIIPNSQAAYLPFGDWRNEPSTSDLTDVGHTGHRHNNTNANDLGLIYMNARYYLPGTGRFASADTIVPDLVNPQSFNRFTYVYNNPMRFNDPSGHIPWDVIDAIFFGISAYQFSVNPTWANAGWLVLDGVSLLPVLPSAGWLRYGDEAADLYNLVTRVARRLDPVGADNLLRIMGRFNDGAQLVFDFLKIGEIPGASKIAQDLATGAGNKVRGSRFELEFAVAHADEIAEIGRQLGGGREIDFVLKNSTFLETKNYNWAASYYQTSGGLQNTINSL